MNVTRRLLGAATAMILAFSLSAGTAIAGNGHGRGHGGHGKGHGNGHRVEHRYSGDHRSYGHHERFVVPHRIVRSAAYAPYYSGRVYYAPHRHAHAVYAFPVYSPYGVVSYAPSYYCGPELYVAAPGYRYDPYYYDRKPHVSVGIHFGF
jgi:hypothetical protein